MCIEPWCNDKRQGKTDVLAENPVAVPLGPPQIPRELARDTEIDVSYK